MLQSDPTPVERLDSGLTLHDALLEALALSGDSPAVIAPDSIISYRELAAIADSVCGFLQASGMPARAIIAVEASSHALSIGAVLGILLSGRAYLPLDPQTPAPVRQRMIGQSGAVMVLTSEAVAALPPGTDKPATPVTDDNSIAAIVYTSATTGEPKGIAISRHCLLFHALTYMRRMCITHADRVSLFSSMHVGASVSNLFSALLCGAAVCPMSLRSLGLGGILSTIADNKLSVLHMVPSLFRRLIRDPYAQQAWQSVHHLKLGGETVTGDDVRLLRNTTLHGIRLMNGLGITEAGGNVTFGEIPADILSGAPAPIGCAVDGVCAEILTLKGYADNEGELIIRSRFLASGYLNDSGPDVFKHHSDGTVSLHTGDLVRRDADGVLTHLGRIDEIVKINGVRVSLIEVESALRNLPGINDAAAAAVPDGTGRVRLHAFYTASSQASVSALRQSLAEVLVPVQIPSFFTQVESLPYGTGGKIKRSALHHIAAASATGFNATHRKPADTLELKLLALWAHVVRTHAIGTHDNLFDLGGDSLLGAQLLTRMYDEFGAQISLEQLYRNPTVAGIAAILRQGSWRDGEQPSVMLRCGRPDHKLFIFPGAGSDVVALWDLAACFTENFSIIGFQYPGLDGKTFCCQTVPDLASFLLPFLRQIQPTGPYRLAGTSFGGMVAFEIAKQLERSGETVAFLGLIDTYAPRYLRFRCHLPMHLKIKALKYWCLPIGRKQEWNILNAGIGLRQKLRLAAERMRWKLLNRPTPFSRRFDGMTAACFDASKNYTIAPVNSPVTIYRAEEQLPDELFEQDEFLGWKNASLSGVRVVPIPGRHGAHIRHPHAADLAHILMSEILKQ